MNGSKTTSDALARLAEQGGAEYLAAICHVIESEDSISTAALRPLADALATLRGRGTLRARLDEFSKSLGLTAKRGRPSSAGEINFFRAYFYWYTRLGGNGMPPVDHVEAIGIVADDYEQCDVSTIEKAVRAHPNAKAYAEGIIDGEKRGLWDGE